MIDRRPDAGHGRQGPTYGRQDPSYGRQDPSYTGITHVGLDADDTLWHSENRFHQAHVEYHDLLAGYVELSPGELEARMLATEQRNLKLFGYGAKGFTISLIETAIEVTGGSIPVREIERIISFGKDLLDHPVELLPGVPDTIERLRDADVRLILVTKGDLWHQESKVASSGLSEHFDGIEIVSEKDVRTYGTVLRRHGVAPERFCMVGNSVRSDVLPVLDIGGHALHVPYEFLWAHEAVEGSDEDARFRTLTSIADVPDEIL